MRRCDGHVSPPARGGPGDGARQKPLWAVAAVAAVAVSVLLVVVGSAAVVGASDRTRPDDPMFGDQWGLENTGQLVNWMQGTSGADIDASRAWNLTTGSDSVVVAVLDGDFDYEAEDLAANVWVNPGGVNGCPAGSHGYDVPSDACEPDASGGHGTSMGWIIGAVGNNGQGISGVNWTTSIMGVSAPLEVSAKKEGIDWIVDARKAGVNVRVINASWGLLPDSPEVRDAITRAGEHGILFVTGAGNNGDDRDVDPTYPCNFDLGNVICVAASDQDDDLAPGSSYGATTVHLAAPGRHICSGPQSNCSGTTSTSDATAFVSGAAALVWAYDPGLSAGQVRSAILGNVDRLESLEGKVATGGRLNVYRAMISTDPASPSPSGSESEPPSPTPSESEPESPSPSPSPSGSDPGSPSPSGSETGSESPSPSNSPTGSPSVSGADGSDGGGGGGWNEETGSGTHDGGSGSLTVEGDSPDRDRDGQLAVDGDGSTSGASDNGGGDRGGADGGQAQTGGGSGPVPTVGIEDAGTADDTDLGAAGSHPDPTTDGASGTSGSVAGAADSQASTARQPDAGGWAWVVVVAGLAAAAVIGSRRMT